MNKIEVKKGSDSPSKLESLYHELLNRFFEEADRARSKSVADRLEKILNGSPEYADSIRGDEIRSILAEVREDFSEAIKWREAEIRKIRDLHSRSINKPTWQFVSQQYDFSDLSDRLDLLAILYDKKGDLDQAIHTLHQSKKYCEEQGIPFDGQELLDELEQERLSPKRRQPSSISHRTRFDEAIREVFQRFDSSVLDLLCDNEKAQRFTDEVNRMLEGTDKIPLLDVKQRLFYLSRRSMKRGGLRRCGGKRANLGPQA